MTTTTSTINTNNIINLVADENGVFQPQETTLEEILTSVGGNSIQHTTFDSQGAKTRRSFVEEFGTDISQVTSLEAALKLSGLDFEVKLFQTRIDINEHTKGMPPRYVKIPDTYSSVRIDTGEVLGTGLSADYQIYQNREAFEFMDSLVAEGAKFTNATMYGATRTGKPNSKIMICMETEGMEILGDQHTPYFLFRNGFDRTVSFTCSFVQLRVFCANAINRALKGATNTITLRHTKSMRDRIELAHRILSSNHQYLDVYKQSAESMALQAFSEDNFYNWVKKIIPIEEGAKEFMVTRKKDAQEALMVAYRQPDLDNFKGTAWRAIQAVSDYESHITKANKGSSTPASFKNIVEQGMPMVNKTWDMLLQVV